MEERYVAFDVETPNAQNRRMSAIGVSVIENGQIVQELYTLVDPQTHFDPFNIALTGITPEEAASGVSFGAVLRITRASEQHRHPLHSPSCSMFCTRSARQKAVPSFCQML